MTPSRTPSQDDQAVEALADAWASIDGKLEKFRAGGAHGYREGYLEEAREMITRLAARGFTIAALEQGSGEPWWQSLPCEEQHKLAERIAANVGYVLMPEPEHPDSPHAPIPTVSGWSELDDPAFQLALAQEVCSSRSGPSFWLADLNDNGREYWRKRIVRNIEDARRAVAEATLSPAPAAPVQGGERKLLEAAREALNCLLAFYHMPGQTYFNTNAWKLAEAKVICVRKQLREYLDAAPSSPAGRDDDDGPMHPGYKGGWGHD